MVTATDWRTEQERRIYEAAGLMPGEHDEHTSSVIAWLAGWDAHTVNGVVKLLSHARVRAVLDVGRAVTDVLDSEEQRANRAAFDILRDETCVCPEGDTLALCRVHGLYGDAEQATVSAPDDSDEGANR